MRASLPPNPTGVDGLWNGSTVADACVTLTADAPADTAAAAAKKLQDGAAGLYAGSGALRLAA